MLANLWKRIFPTVSRRKARAIAVGCFRPPPASAFQIRSGLPSNAHFYNAPDEPFWCVHAPWGDGLDSLCLRNSRIILISKRSGKILYDGSAHDEG